MQVYQIEFCLSIEFPQKYKKVGSHSTITQNSCPSFQAFISQISASTVTPALNPVNLIQKRLVIQKQILFTAMSHQGRHPLKQLLLQNIVDRSVTRFLFRLLAGIRNDGRQYWIRQTHCQTSETIFIHTQRERIMSKRGSPSVLSAPEDHRRSP